MSDLKISALTDGIGFQDGDEIPIARSGANFRVRAFIAVRAKKSTTQAISTGTWTSLSWDQEDYDTDAFHDNTTNNNRITIPTGLGGKYQLRVGIGFAANTGGIRGAQVTKNTTTPNTNVIGAIAADAPKNAISWFGTLDAGFISLSAGDWINVNVYQDTGGNLNVNDQSNMFFELLKVA